MWRLEHARARRDGQPARERVRRSQLDRQAGGCEAARDVRGQPAVAGRPAGWPGGRPLADRLAGGRPANLPE